MIVLEPGQLKQISDLAEAAYPRECCGLLVGTIDDHAGPEEKHEGTARVTRVERSDNLAPDDRDDRFEIDPRVRLRLQKELRSSGETLIGVYHSHPDGPAQPSDTDLENAWEPELIWLITAVIEGQATHTTAHRLIDQATRFEQIALRTTDWHEAVSRSPAEMPGGRPLPAQARGRGNAGQIS